MALHLVTGLVIGVAAGLLVPRVAPILRPFAKSMIKAGVIAYDHARVAVAELNESTDDAIAEVRAEIEEERKAAGGQPRSKASS
ncbi:DUF5132 domain-containing protein [Sinorhizobium numidicum]|uniref:DUF5132 domain-containing protein n=1 Tax=Sinorhizobium numidicum TaxID=680248 RepID=A0ABY8CSC6_9HYPH|nr:DUF5132 domain-containing protein [Sinorhizobium numidicum]WEX74809.1 DUF5132 domain-containing protein [Sinorhizobium numidicum]WEX80802.1 DUF5132 domain-containing protein [Sinorhizobium numidicum]